MGNKFETMDLNLGSASKVKTNVPQTGKSPSLKELDSDLGVCSKKGMETSNIPTSAFSEMISSARDQLSGTFTGKGAEPHPGFQSVAAEIGEKYGGGEKGKKIGAAILAKKTRGASEVAKERNPNLRKVKGEADKSFDDLEEKGIVSNLKQRSEEAKARDAAFGEKHPLAGPAALAATVPVGYAVARGLARKSIESGDLEEKCVGRGSAKFIPGEAIKCSSNFAGKVKTKSAYMDAIRADNDATASDAAASKTPAPAASSTPTPGLSKSSSPPTDSTPAPKSPSIFSKYLSGTTGMASQEKSISLQVKPGIDNMGHPVVKKGLGQKLTHAGIGAVVGGAAGAATDKENRARGAFQGGVLGAAGGHVVGGAAKEAVKREGAKKIKNIVGLKRDFQGEERKVSRQYINNELRDIPHEGKRAEFGIKLNQLGKRIGELKEEGLRAAQKTKRNSKLAGKVGAGVGGVTLGTAGGYGASKYDEAKHRRDQSGKFASKGFRGGDKLTAGVTGLGIGAGLGVAGKTKYDEMKQSAVKKGMFRPIKEVIKDPKVRSEARGLGVGLGAGLGIGAGVTNAIKNKRARKED